MRRRIVDGNSFAFLCDDVNELEHSVQEKLPRVSVIMPLKGFGEHNLQNWRTQVWTDCNGSYDLWPLLFMMLNTGVYVINKKNNTDHISLWGATGIPVCSRKQRWSSLSCCFTFDSRIQGKQKTLQVITNSVILQHLSVTLFICCNNLVSSYDFQDKLEAKVVVAGLSTTCSQKIHNQLVRKSLHSRPWCVILFHYAKLELI